MWVQGAGCRVQGAGCRVQGAGCRVQGAECRVGPPRCGERTRRSTRRRSLPPSRSPGGGSSLCGDIRLGKEFYFKTILDTPKCITHVLFNYMYGPFSSNVCHPDAINRKLWCSGGRVRTDGKRSHEHPPVCDVRHLHRVPSPHTNCL